MYNFTLLSETCENLGLSHRDVAKSLNVSEATVSRYMRGEVKDASFDLMADLCSLLHLSMDVVAGREAMVEVPLSEGKNMTENLIIIRDFVRRNFERLRTIEHEKDAAFNRHIDHLKEQLDNRKEESSAYVLHLTAQLDKYSKQFRRYNFTIYAFIAFCSLMFGVMIMMFVNNRALQGQVSTLKANTAYFMEYSDSDLSDGFPE